MSVFGQLKHAWNAFLDQNENYRIRPYDMGTSYGTRPDRVRLHISNERSIVSAIYLRLALDLASVDIRHIRLDDQGRFKEDMVSGLQERLQLEANIDQAAQAFFIDAYLTMFDEGVIAIVPVKTDVSPEGGGSVNILDWRIGRIVQWFPRHVRVNLYNDETGRREEVTLEKSAVAIVENPLYTVMNEPNSTLQRLIRKLGLLDMVDEQSSSGKLDMIIQLPYVIKSESRRKQAEQRRQDIEFQLKGSKYGIAYTDGTEKITQLNRPAENNLLKQVEVLTDMLYSQMGLTPEVMLGTAEESAMLNYNNRTLNPILTAMVQEIKRKFLSKTARTQKQSVDYFQDLFKIVPMSVLAEIADKFTRNEIVSSNEFRGFIGMKPSTDPKADELRNANMPEPLDPASAPAPAAPTPAAGEDVPDDLFAGINEALDSAFKSVEELTNGSG
jgi:hypothetical protein